MLKLQDSDLRTHSEVFFNAAAKGGKAALFFDDFIKNTLISLYSNTPFPKQVKLCRTVEEMIDGDFSPGEVVEMSPPELLLTLEENGKKAEFKIPLWRGSTLAHEGVMLRGAGYINGDSRKPCNIALDDKVPHGLLAGATGHGKSVALNGIINAACLEYAPWEVQFVLVDAKVVEFKTYGINDHIPHISSIAATSDAEFIISVLEDAYTTMMLRNSVFTKAGAKNISSFRKQTGLAMPHIMIVMDEFQTMFMNAARKAKAINELIAKVARLGRNTGVHLLLASQELGQELDKSVLGNIGTRLCLGCMPSTSVQILGNDEAKTNFKQKGRLIINNNPAKENNVDENVALRTPWLPDESIAHYKTIFDYLTLLKDLGKKAKSTPFYNMSFYDEEEKCYEDKFPLAIQSKAKPCLLYLGEPSFVLHNDDGEKWLRIELKEDIGQNILIFSPMQKNRERYLLMLQHNIAEMKRQGAEVQTLLFYSNRDSFSRIDIGLAKKPSYVRDFSPAMEAQLSGPLIRRIMVECDDIAFGNVSFDDEDMKLYQEVVNKENQFSGELWQKRAQTLFNLYKGPFAKQFGIDSITNNDKKLSALSGRVLATMSAFRNMGCEVSKLTRDSLKPQFIIIHGLEQIAQLGVDVKSGRVEAFKKIINEAPEYKVYFIITTSTLEDASSLRSAIAHVLCDNLTGQMQGHLKIADYYPESCSPALGIYYCSTKEEDRCVKFKKMIFRGEVM